jgi:hypothetical protein
VNKNRTDTRRSEWDGRSGPDGQKQEAVASCSPPEAMGGRQGDGTIAAVMTANGVSDVSN